MKEVTVSEYFREKKRLTKNCRINCTNCPLSKHNNQEDLACYDLEYDCPDVAIFIVQKWAKESPRKTFLQDFLEKHPKAALGCDGTPTTCTSKLGYTGVRFCDYTKGCYNCWHRPMEEE